MIYHFLTVRTSNGFLIDKKNDGKTIFTYDGPEEDFADDEKVVCVLEKSGKWYYYILNNKKQCFAGI